jgi:hypothetical protein
MRYTGKNQVISQVRRMAKKMMTIMKKMMKKRKSTTWI